MPKIILEYGERFEGFVRRNSTQVIDDLGRLFGGGAEHIEKGRFSVVVEPKPGVTLFETVRNVFSDEDVELDFRTKECPVFRIK